MESWHPNFVYEFRTRISLSEIRIPFSGTCREVIFTHENNGRAHFTDKSQEETKVSLTRAKEHSSHCEFGYRLRNSGIWMHTLTKRLVRKEKFGHEIRTRISHRFSGIWNYSSGSFSIVPEFVYDFHIPKIGSRFSGIWNSTLMKIICLLFMLFSFLIFIAHHCRQG